MRFWFGFNKKMLLKSRHLDNSWRTRKDTSFFPLWFWHIEIRINDELSMKKWMTVYLLTILYEIKIRLHLHSVVVREIVFCRKYELGFSFVKDSISTSYASFINFGRTNHFWFLEVLLWEQNVLILCNVFGFEVNKSKLFLYFCLCLDCCSNSLTKRK